MSGSTMHEMRLGDRERAKALRSLTKHHARGRIDADELDERTDAVRTARTYGDLQAVFSDLGWSRPVPGPADYSHAYGGWTPPARGPRRGPFPFLLLALVVLGVVTAATGNVPWIAIAIVAVVLLLTAPWRRRRWHGSSRGAC